MPNNVDLISGAEVLVRDLKKFGVETIFAITGAGNLAIIDAIARDGDIRLIYSHHEQAAVMEAQGYSRVSGKIGVALVTTGGGTSNVVTGVLGAYLDSIPVLLISGNESSFHCTNKHLLRAYGVQGFDSCAVLAPVTKFSTRIESTESISQILAKAHNIALKDRMGPTHIDFPMDLQRKTVDIKELIQVKISEAESAIPKDLINKLITALINSKAPLFYFGNGIRKSDSQELVQELINKTGIPYFHSWSAIDIFQEQDPLNIGRVGIYGDRHANILLQKSDLIVAIGTRLAIPQLGYDKADFGRCAAKWVIEIDPTECAKFEELGWNIINSDAQHVLEELNSANFEGFSAQNWASDCQEMRARLPRKAQLGPEVSDPENQIHSGEVLNFLNSNLSHDAIIATDVGAALLTGHYMYEQSGGRRLFTSQGLGEMGFGLPSAIGAYFANPNRQIVCLNTDGAMMFNLQELQLVTEHKIPLKLFIFNNLGYSMIKISQDNLFEGRLSGSTVKSGVSFPSFHQIAITFNLNYSSVSNVAELPRITSALKSNTAELIEIKMDPDQKYYPRLATNKLADGTLVSPPLEDLDPKIEISLLEELLGYKAHANSYKARGL